MCDVQDSLGTLALGPLSTAWAEGKVECKSRGFLCQAAEAVSTRKACHGEEAAETPLSEDPARPQLGLLALGREGVFESL